jgi:amino acid permease
MLSTPILALSAGFEDTLANIISWLAFIIVPVLFVSLFWLVHILPQKKAEKRHHPQAEAIHIMCLMSLFFGGLLWPIAFIWAYMKPVRLQVEPAAAAALTVPPAGPPALASAAEKPAH